MLLLWPPRTGLVRRSAARATAVSAVLLAVGLLSAPQVASAAAAQARAASSCKHATGPFRVSGTRVLGAHGKVFVPYGITVTGLALADYKELLPLDHAKIKATAGFWCANTVRLQISQDTLVGPKGTTISNALLLAIAGEVKLALKNHLVVVLNAQTEDVGDEPAPTKATAAFWRLLSQLYGHNPQVIFDLFNQPRIETQARCGLPADWSGWLTGEHFQGRYYLGMQTLVNDVRADGAKNLLWAEGPCYANSLAGLGQHLIKGSNIVYAYQHPHGLHDKAQWNADFGWLLAKHVAPVVNAEWSNYAANKSECWADAPKGVPAYLRYLQAHGIGMTAFGLKEGQLIKTKNLDDPTHIYTKGRLKWRCVNSLDEGIGTAIHGWYRSRDS
jgi:endoglucanase